MLRKTIPESRDQWRGQRRMHEEVLGEKKYWGLQEDGVDCWIGRVGYPLNWGDIEGRRQKFLL